MINEDKIAFYANALGHSGALSDLENEWLKTKVTPNNLSTSDLWKAYLATQGITDGVSDGKWQLPYPLGSGTGLPIPLVLDLFTSTVGYSTSASNCTVSLDTSVIPGVANSVKYVTTAVGSGQGISGPKTLATQYNPDTDFGDVIAFLVDWDRYTTNQVQFEIGRGSTYGGVSAVVNTDYVTPGPTWLAFPKSSFPNMPVGLGDIKLRPRYSTRTPSNTEVKYYAAVANCKGEPTFALRLDDDWSSAYTRVWPFFRDTLGPDAFFSVMVNPSAIGQPSRNTLASLQEMYAYGIDMCCDSPGDNGYFFWDDPAGAVTQMLSVRQYLVDNGMPRGSIDGCYPGGMFIASDTLPSGGHGGVPNVGVRSNDVVANGTNTITYTTLISASPAGTVPAIGMSVFGGFGANKVSGLTVTNVVGTTITLSGTVNAAVTRLAFVDLTSPFTPSALPAAFAAQGCGIWTTTMGGGTSGSASYLPNFTRFGFGGRMQMMPGQGYTNGVLANMKLDLEKVAAVGGTIFPYTHNVYPGGTGLDMDYDLFQQWCLYAKQLGFKFRSYSQVRERDQFGYEQLL